MTRDKAHAKLNPLFVRLLLEDTLARRLVRWAVLAAVASVPLTFSLSPSIAALAAPSTVAVHGVALAQSAVAQSQVTQNDMLNAISARAAAPATAPQCYGTECDYYTPDSNDWCFVVEPQTITNWDDVPGDAAAACRNVDESFYNSNSGVVRLYYHPLNIDSGGAWACVPAYTYLSDLAGYVFNNGPNAPGYGQAVWNNVGGSTYDWGGTCLNPITNG